MQTQVSSKTALPVSLAEAKTHLRVANSDLDTSIQLALESAVSFVEDHLARSLRETETLVQSHGSWPDSPVSFDRQPVKAITSVTYYDSDNVEQTVAASNYRLLTVTRAATRLEFDSEFARPALYARGDAVNITYTAGYAKEGDTVLVPAQAKWAILLKLDLDWGDLMPRERDATERSLQSLLANVDWGSYR